MPHRQLVNLFLEQSKDLFWIIDSGFYLVYANQAYQKVMKQVTGEERKIGEPVFIEGVSDDYIKKLKAYYERGLNGEHFEIVENFYNPYIEQVEYSEISFKPITNQNEVVINVACQSRDITSFVKSNAEAEIIMDASLDVICQIDQKGIFTKVSAACKELWGYEKHELVGKPYNNFVIEEDNEKLNKGSSEMLKGKTLTTFENRYKKKDGGIAFNLWSARYDPNTKNIFAVARDGKEKFKKEELLIESENRFKALVQEGSDLIGILNETGIYSYVSPTSMGILGIKPEEFMGKNPFDYIHLEDAERVMDSLNKITYESRVEVEPYRFKNKNGEWRWIETVLTNMLSNPAIKGIVANSRDITIKKKENEHLKLLESVITNTKDAVMITEAERFDEPGPRILFVNDAFTKMTGYHSDEVIGKTPRIFQGPKSNRAELKRLSEAIRRWETSEITTINYKKNGEEYWIKFTLTPIANEKGWYTHWIAIQRDVTRRKLAEIQLNELNNNLQNHANKLSLSNAELEQFAYVASHDLQEPLRMITSFLILIEKKYGEILDDTGKKYIDFAVDGAQRMRQIILDFLEYSRVGRSGDEQEELDLNELIDEIKILHRNKIAEKEAVFIIDALPKIHAYKSAMLQVFQNLISNALKYSNEAIPVQIHITAKELAHHWQFAVVDNGIGIKKEYFSKVFIIFQRLHTKEQYPGTGLGLAIVKKIIEMNGGEIHVESEEGKGSTFYFTVKK